MANHQRRETRAQWEKRHPGITSGRAQVLAHGSRGLPRLSEVELLRGLVRQSLPVDKFPQELTEALYDAGLNVFTNGDVIGMMLNDRGRACAWRIAKRAAKSANRDKQSGEAPDRQLALQAISPPRDQRQTHMD